MSSGTKLIGPSRAAARLNFARPQSPFSGRRTFLTTPAQYDRGSLPRIASPSLWTSIVPKFIRERKSRSPQDGRRKGWNPATYFIVMFVFIGSQAIRTLTLRNDFNNYVRSTDAKIRLLREVIEKLHRGEEVDVRGLLGTGDPKAEAEWNEVIREIEESDGDWKPKQPQPKQKQTQADTKPQESDPDNVTLPSAEQPPAEEQKRKANFF